MKIGLYVVTEAIEVSGRSVEIVSPEEGLGGIYEDGALALQAILTNLDGDAVRDRFLYAASFDDGALRLDHMILGLCFDKSINRFRILTEPK